jgi:hypothetical protein
MPQLDIKIKRFVREELRVSDVRFTVLKLVSEEERRVSGDPLEVTARILEEESKSQGLDYVVVEVQGQGFKSVVGEGSRRGSGIILYPKPAQLKRVGVVRVQALKPAGSSGYYRFNESDIEWFSVDDERVYVYDVEVEAPQDIVFLVVDTSDGRSIARIQRSSLPQQSYQPQPQQGQSTESSES